VHPDSRPQATGRPQWVHGIKHDGYRLLVRRDGERVRLFTRRGYDWTEYRLLTPAHLRLRTAAIRAVLATLHRYLRLIIVCGAAAIWVGGSKLNDVWQLHQQLLAERAGLEKQIGKRINANTTLVGARVGITTLTRTYNSTMRIDSINLPASQAAAQRDLCAEKKTQIKNGASYNLEFQEPNGTLIARFEVSSCP
jgi:hypothetical protein